eukprot:Gb_31320 [translate_table: standard]
MFLLNWLSYSDAEYLIDEGSLRVFLILGQTGSETRSQERRANSNQNLQQESFLEVIQDLGVMTCFGYWYVCKTAFTHVGSPVLQYARIIQKLGFPAHFKDFKIQNIVGSCDVKFPIRLEGLAYAHGAFSSYEPELFPGLIYRMKQPKIVLLIFVSGKIVLTGAKVREETYTAFENIYPVLNEFRKIQQYDWVYFPFLDKSVRTRAHYMSCQESTQMDSWPAPVMA